MHLVCFERRPRPRPGAHVESMGEAALGLEALESGRPGVRRLGALLRLGPHAGSVVDLNRALAIKLAIDDVGAPEAEADSLVPADVMAFLKRLPESLDSARIALEFVADSLERYDAPDVLRAGIVEPPHSVRICSPVPRPGKLVGVLGGYDGEGRAPELFLKASSAVVGPEDDVRLPEGASAVDFEGSLAAVIGVRARDVSTGDALSHVAGYTAANDVTARDLASASGVAKSCDSFAPLGPALVTPDEIPDPQDLGLSTLVSGETLQAASTKQMRFGVAQVVAYASSLMTLEPGDVILTGSPPGSGGSRNPPRWLRDGDLVQVEIEKIGRLRNYVRAGARRR